MDFQSKIEEYESLKSEYKKLVDNFNVSSM